MRPIDYSYFGFHLEQTEESEEDNVKIWHTITTPKGDEVTIDHSPYEWISPEIFRLYVLFYKQNNRFPTRRDINSSGPLHAEDIVELTR